MTLAGGVTVKIIAGTVSGVGGPVNDIVIDPEMLDVTVPPGTVFKHPVPGGHTVVVYILSGEATFDDSGKSWHRETVLLFERNGDAVKVETRQEAVRFVLVSGKPLGETFRQNGTWSWMLNIKEII